MKIADTLAIVTGAASGLGAATAQALAKAGVKVTILDRDRKGAETAETIGAHFVEVDVTDDASVTNAIAKASDLMGGLTAAISCAGIAGAAKMVGRDGPHDLALWQRTLDINLTGSFNIARHAAAAMATNEPNEDGERGIIINTASVAAFEGQKGQAAYAASKGGIAGMTLPAARDLASLGIRVNAIAPGIFLTPMLEGLGQDVMDGLAKDVVFPKRLGNPSEFASLVIHMIENAYLNGTVIRLDGALRMP